MVFSHSQCLQRQSFDLVLQRLHKPQSLSGLSVSSTVLLQHAALHFGKSRKRSLSSSVRPSGGNDGMLCANAASST
ncbi:MAG: hypothetical protein CMP20_02695 [Rickettsiales bacterium]|nr:hypothetical protein [Rickettsiales bacterium]